MTPLISTAELLARLDDPALVIADIRWEAQPPDAGINAYRVEHIPVAIFVDLDTHLSDRSDLSRGRHPLPDPERLAETLARLGIGQNTVLVVYDDKAGSLAARLWWMMRWIGGPEARVLDGGFTLWASEGRPVETGSGRNIIPAAQPVVPNLNPALVARLEVVEALDKNTLLLDARAPERYRGEEETIDARAGHIPHAMNAPWKENVDGLLEIFKSRAELRARFEKSGVAEDSDVICYCGSGVTACHNLLALDLAGFHGARLYPGSWSEWVARRPPQSNER